MVRVDATKVRQGDFTVSATCRYGHTGFKKAGDTESTYKCPYCERSLP